MSITTIVDTYSKLRGGNVLEMIMDEDLENEVGLLHKELKKDAEVARDVILAGMPEERFVKLVAMIQKISVVLGLGNGTLVARADISNELQSYTHTVVLATIGALIEDEVL